MKLKLEIEIEYDKDLMHGEDEDAIAWFHDQVLFTDERLILYSNCIGGEIGLVKVTRIIHEDNMGDI
jgi:hypothetical protein